MPGSGILVIRRWPIAALLLAALVGPAPGTAIREEPPARSREDPRLDRLRRAMAAWEPRIGSRRTVVDAVCLVPDEATFFEALARWDEDHWFPILIEDVEYTSKFLRAFRPARVVRYPNRAPTVGGVLRWRNAVKAVGRSWTDDDDDPPSGDRRSASNRGGAPGLVVSNPQATMLAGASALAAGHLQPLIRWEPGGSFGEMLSNADAQKMAEDLRAIVAEVAPDYDRLGDDCDFLTLALDYPYRYEGKGVTARPGPAAVDDLLGRHLGVPNPDLVRVRWAFNGRLLGDEVRAVYEAMCSLFLRPDRATLINAYGEGGGPPFGPFSLKPAAETLEGLMEVNRLDRDEADLGGWQSAFGPINRSGLVMINSSGNPSDFRIGGKVQARTWDVPLTSPAVVSMIHSFSAANPNEPGTIAGRWLANGAYVYFGSVHEPYVQSFRTPELLADLLDAGFPFGASVRMLPEESPPFGNCWRLAYLGDPLFRIDPEGPPERVASWPPATDWPSYEAPTEPSSDADPFSVLSWAIKLNIDLARRDAPPSTAMADRLRQIDPRALDGVLREYRDLLLADALTRLDRLGDLRDDLGGRPPDAIGPSARRWLEASQVIGIQRALEADDWEAAAAIWAGLARSSPHPGLLKMATERLRPDGSSAQRRGRWARVVREALATVPKGPLFDAIKEELNRTAVGN